MSGWRPALLALLVWAFHFFAAYGLMLIFPDAPGVGWATLGLGLACLAVLGWIAWSTPRNANVIAAAALSGIAIIWQSIVGLF